MRHPELSHPDLEAPGRKVPEIVPDDETLAERALRASRRPWVQAVCLVALPGWVLCRNCPWAALLLPLAVCVCILALAERTRQ